MAGYYIISSPSQRIINQESEYAIKKADLRSIAECVASAQNSAMYAEEFNNDCVERYKVSSQYICMNKQYNIVECNLEGASVPDFNFIITTSSVLPQTEYNNMLEIIEKYYPDAGTFGIFLSPYLLSADSMNKRTIPQNIVNKANLQNGQLVYLMQYKIPEANVDYATTEDNEIECPDGTMKTYRFGRWQCVEYNYKTSCSGDTIWDSDLLKCVEDETRKPLCATNQTAVMVDNVWECLDPFTDKVCENDMIARLNYNTLEWECVQDPNKETEKSKCTNMIREVPSHASVGATLRVRSVSCTDCETAVIDEDTCETYCIPDPTKLNNLSCYAGLIEECSGPTRALYFGFDSNSRIDGISELENQTIELDENHNQNRKFNCLDCGEYLIDTEKSIYPYTAICK